MKNSNVENISISSLNSSKNIERISKTKKSDIHPQHTTSEINLEELNCSLNQNDISYNSIANFKNKSNKLTPTFDYSTAENNYSPDIRLKKKKLHRKMQNSQIKENLNDTQCAMSSFREKINESSISNIDEKDNNYIMTNNDNSIIHMNNNLSSNNFNFQSSNYITTEEKLRNLVKQTKRTSNKYISTNINKQDLEDFESGTISNNFNPINEKDTFEIKNHNQYSNFELSKILFEIIHSAPDSMTIILPPRYISFPYLVINNNLKIKGCPGTLVEINNGFILIAGKNKQNVSFSECSFVFNFELKSFKEKIKNDDILKNNVTIINEKYNISLFKISSEACNINVNDCDFRSIVHEDEEVLEDFSENRIICETCFSLCTSNSQLLLQSTICSNFYKIIDALDALQITLDNCHFSDTISNAISLKNIKIFNFVFSTLSNCYNAIEILYSDMKNNILTSNLTENLNEGLNEVSDGIIKIKITDSEFNQNHNFALKILAESYNIQVKMEIRKNIFKQNKNGIIINKILIYSLDILENEVKNNLEGGIEISNLNVITKKTNYDDSFTKLLTVENTNAYDTISNDANIKIFKNEIKDNKNKVGLKIENCNNIKIQLDDNKISNNLIGILISNLNNGLIMMKKASISENLEVGMQVTNIPVNTKIFISACKIFKNFLYGTKLENKAPSGITYPIVYIKNLEISNNKKGGIYFTNFALSIENTVITDNGQWAIEMPIENNKTILKLVNYDTKNLNSFINNAIGGTWGTIENKKSICSNGKCSIL